MKRNKRTQLEKIKVWATNEKCKAPYYIVTMKTKLKNGLRDVLGMKQKAIEEVKNLSRLADFKNWYFEAEIV